MSALDEVLDNVPEQAAGVATLARARHELHGLRALLEESAQYARRRLGEHQAIPPEGSMRWLDYRSGKSFDESRECDCDYCQQARRLLGQYAKLHDTHPLD